MKRIVLAMLFLCGTAGPLHALDFGLEFTRKMNDGISAYEKGEYVHAQTLFQEALLLRPDSAEARMNLGLANARLEHHDVADLTFDEVAQMSVQERDRLADALYNRGRNQYAHAESLLNAEKPDLDGALKTALDALGSCNECLKVKPGLEAAEINRARTQQLIEDIAKKKLEQLQQQQQPKKGDDQNSQEGDQDQQNQDQSQQGDQQEKPEQSQDQQEGDPDQQQEKDPEQQGNQSQEQQQPTGTPKNPQESQEGEKESQGDDEGKDSQTQESEQQSAQPSDQQEDTEQSANQEGAAGAGQPAEKTIGMTPEEAKNLLNLVGNSDILRFRVPSRSNQPRKQW